MSKKNKKPGQAHQFSPKQVQLNTMKLLREACDQMVGTGSFDQFSEGLPIEAIVASFTGIETEGAAGFGF